jgi:hypothetical protein
MSVPDDERYRSGADESTRTAVMDGRCSSTWHRQKVDSLLIAPR